MVGAGLIGCLAPAASLSLPTISTAAGGGTSQDEGVPAAQALLKYPEDLAVDGAGNLYLSDRSTLRVRKIDTQGVIRTVAGNGQGGYNGDGIAATSATLVPMGIAVDAQGNLFIAEDVRIRMVSPSGVITTLVGDGNRGFSGDGGPAIAASISSPIDPEVDAQGNLYFIDRGNRRVRKLTPDGVISTVVGNGSFSGTFPEGTRALDVGFEAQGLGISPSGEILLVGGFDHRVYRLDQQGRLWTVAGGGFFGADPMATNVVLHGLRDVASDARGNVYVSQNAIVQMIAPDGAIHLVAGRHNRRDGFADVETGYGGDGGPAVQALLKDVVGLAVTPDGQLFVADRGNARVRKITPVSQPETPAGMFALRWAGDRDGGGGAVVSGDFNGDGRADLATVSKPGRYDYEYWAVGSVCLLLQSSAGAFEDEGSSCINMPAPTAPLPTRPSPTFRGVGLAVADMNGDGIDDVLASSGAGIAIVPGSRQRDFRSSWFSGVWNTPADELVVTDVNRDGAPDVVVRTVESRGSQNMGLGIYQSSRSGVAYSFRFMPLDFDLSSLRAADLSGDGREDLAMGYVRGSGGEGGAAVLRHDGQGGFLSPQLYPVTGSGRASVAVGSFNGDRRRDLAVARVGYQSGTLIHMFHQDPYGALQPATPLEATPQPTGLLAVDLDRDTLDDLLVLGGSNWSVGYYQSRYGRGLDAQVRYAVSPPDEEDVNTLVATDVNHDGHLDVVQVSSGRLDFLYGTGRRWGTAAPGSHPLLPGGQAVRSATPQPLATTLAVAPSSASSRTIEQGGRWGSSRDARWLQSLPQRLAWTTRAASIMRGWIAQLSGWWSSLLSSNTSGTTPEAPMERVRNTLDAGVARTASSSGTWKPPQKRNPFVPTSIGLRRCDRFR